MDTIFTMVMPNHPKLTWGMWVMLNTVPSLRALGKMVNATIGDKVFSGCWEKDHVIRYCVLRMRSSMSWFIESTMNTWRK